MIPQGTVYIIAAASGTGKTSLAQALVDSVENIKISISHTTRPIRNGEKDKQSYFFVTTPTFEELIQKQAFLEYAKVFDSYYGTSRQWVEEQLQAGIDVILDIDWQGAQQVRRQISCTSIFLLPPSRAELQKRLETRKREDATVIAGRMAAASSEITHYSEFDYIVINDKFAQALLDLQAIIKSNRLRKEQQAKKYDKIIKELLINT